MTSGSLGHPLHATPALDPLELMQTIQLSQETVRQDEAVPFRYRTSMPEHSTQ